MGCHTWFRIPHIEGKEQIIERAKLRLEKASKYLHESTIKMYQYAIDNELIEPCLELAAMTDEDEISLSNIDVNGTLSWTLYANPTNVAISLYNNDTSHNDVVDEFDYKKIAKLGLETYSNEPRIGGYPDRVVTSYEDMLDFMSTGFTDEEGKHYMFYYDEDRKDTFMQGIKSFFEKHPKGIITFA